MKECVAAVIRLAFAKERPLQNTDKGGMLWLAHFKS
jgi:hypothetical protein